MDSLRRHLGRHPNHLPGQLHVLEVGALVLRAGRAAGFTVRTEIPVRGEVEGKQMSGEMDCGWFSQAGQIIAAWEFDGRDVGDWHMLGGRRVTKDAKVKYRLGNQRKFEKCGSPIRVQVYYSLRNDLTAKGPLRPAFDSALFRSVVFVSDEQLMGDSVHSINDFIHKAQQLIQT